MEGMPLGRSSANTPKWSYLKVVHSYLSCKWVFQSRDPLSPLPAGDDDALKALLELGVLVGHELGPGEVVIWGETVFRLNAIP